MGPLERSDVYHGKVSRGKETVWRLDMGADAAPLFGLLGSFVRVDRLEEGPSVKVGPGASFSCVLFCVCVYFLVDKGGEKMENIIDD